ncbi:MAG: Na+/H+ antiporter subunit E [Gammaproteobacteria bacterium]|nr:Na+/H+ antiporter subunit E [Gammaproteobacteria bacterium]
MSGSETSAAVPISAIAMLFLSSLLLWLALVGSFDAQELATGIIVSATITVLYYRRMTVFIGLRPAWLMPFYILVYLVDFITALVVANLDLARRVLTPSLPIQPEIVEIETALQSDLGRLLLANTITLTPGTLSVDFEGNRLFVHWVYCPSGLDSKQVTEKIAGRFERHLARFVK